MNYIQTIIIAIVEGLTEYLPVSSTGHMIITQALLGVESSEYVKAFTVNIQFGAILSVVVLYWKRFFNVVKLEANEFSNESGLKKSWFKLEKKYNFYVKLFVAFLPAAFIGLLLGDYIDLLLENVTVVAVMLVLGGLFMLFLDKLFNKTTDDQSITYKRAWMIGFFQCIAMIPGVSRSMATIVGGMANKLTRKTAAEFSFFLAVPTMFAASGYKLVKLVMEPVGFDPTAPELSGMDVLSQNIPGLILGNVVAFIVAMFAIKFFIAFLTKYGFKAFGWYRIIAGGAILVMLGLNIPLEVL